MRYWIVLIGMAFTWILVEDVVFAQSPVIVGTVDKFAVKEVAWSEDGSSLLWKLENGHEAQLNLRTLEYTEAEDFESPELSDESEEWRIDGTSLVSNTDAPSTPPNELSLLDYHVSLATFANPDSGVIATEPSGLFFFRITRSPLGQYLNNVQQFGNEEKVKSLSVTGRYVATTNDRTISIWDFVPLGKYGRTPVMRIEVASETLITVHVGDKPFELNEEGDALTPNANLVKLLALRWSPQSLVSDYVLDVIEQDLKTLKTSQEKKSARYFIDTHRWLNGHHEIGDRSNISRELSFCVNSLSWGKALTPVTQVDDFATVFRMHLNTYEDVDLEKWSEKTWHQFVQREICPLLVPANSEQIRRIQEATASTRPWIRADWFLHSASQPPLYHNILGLPRSERGLERLLLKTIAEVDLALPQTELPTRVVVKAGDPASTAQPSKRDRLLERHVIPKSSTETNGQVRYPNAGFYWKSYDFGYTTGQLVDDRSILVSHPFGSEKGKLSCLRSGGEMIFSLPNGLQAYFICDQYGTRLDEAPVEVVMDTMRNDVKIRTGVSCMNCHSEGIKPGIDRIRIAIDADPKAFGELAEPIKRLHRDQEELAKTFNRDQKKFQSALNTLVGSPTVPRDIFPNTATSLSPTDVATEFGIAVESLSSRINALPSSLRRHFVVLKSDDGRIERIVFEKLAKEVHVYFSQMQ